MFGKLSTVFFALATTALSVSALNIDTPEKLTQCNSVTLNWHGKNAPFTLHVLPSCESGSEESLLVLPPMNATTYKWTVNLPSKTGAIAFGIVDALGNEAFTDELDIGKSDNTACFNAAASSSSSSVASSSVLPTTTTGTVTPSATIAPTTLIVTSTSATSTLVAPINVGGGPASGSGSGSGSTTPQANGAITNAVSILVGAVGVATSVFALI